MTNHRCLATTWLRLGLALALLAAPVTADEASKAAAHRQVLGILGAIEDAGRYVELKTIEGLAHLEHLAHLELEVTEVNEEQGYVLGKAVFLGDTVPMCLMNVSGFDGRPHWTVCIQQPSFGFVSFFGDTKVTETLDGLLQTPSGMFVLAKDAHTVSGKDMPEPVRKYFEEIFGQDDMHVSFAPGLNLFLGIDIRRAGDLGKLLDLAGFPHPGAPSSAEVGQEGDSMWASNLILQGGLEIPFGAMWGKLRGKAEKKPEDWSKTKQKSLAGLSLQATLPVWKPPFDCDLFRGGTCLFKVTGAPSVEVDLRVMTSLGDDEETWDGIIRLGVDPAELEAALALVGKMDGEWSEPLGISGLQLHNAVLKIEFNLAEQDVDVGAGGAFRFAGKEVKLALKVGWSLDQERLTNLILYNEVDEAFTLRELASAMVRLAEGPEDPPDCNQWGLDCKDPPPRHEPDVSGLPDIALVDAKVKIATKGDDDLGVKPGIQVDGTLMVNGERFCSAGAYLGLDGFDAVKGFAGFKVHGELDMLDMGIVKVKDAQVVIDVSLGPPTFHVQGITDVLGRHDEVLVDVSSQGFTFAVTDNLFDLFETELTARAPMGTDFDWFVKGNFRNDFHHWLEDHIFHQAQSKAREAQAKLGKARHELDIALHRVRTLQARTNAMRTRVMRERMELVARLKAARHKVEELDKKIAEQRREVQHERDMARAAIDHAKQGIDLAERKFHEYKSKAQHAPAYRPDLKAKYGAQAATAWTALQASKAALPGIMKANEWVLDAAPVDADPRVGSLLTARVAAKKSLDGLIAVTGFINDKTPVDADPRVASLIAAEKTAEGTLKVAKKTLELLEEGVKLGAAVGDFLAKKLGRAVVVERASFDVRLKELIETGRTGKLHLQVIFLGKRKVFDAEFDFRAAEEAALNLANELFGLDLSREDDEEDPGDFGGGGGQIDKDYKDYLDGKVVTKTIGGAFRQKTRVLWYEDPRKPPGSYLFCCWDFFDAWPRVRRLRGRPVSVPFYYSLDALDSEQLAWLDKRMADMKLDASATEEELLEAVFWAGEKDTPATMVPDYVRKHLKPPPGGPLCASKRNSAPDENYLWQLDPGLEPGRGLLDGN